MSDEGPFLVNAGPSLARAGLPHRIFFPTANKPYPTVVMLHGRSGDEDAMWIFARALPKDWLVVSPRGIKRDPAGGYAWHPRQRDEWPPLPMFDEAVAALTHFLQALPELYGADPDHFYLMGFSQGAATAYATAMRYPDLVQGIAGLVGFVPIESDAAVETRVLANLPIYTAVGKEDPFIPLARARGCAETLRASGADLAYREYDTGHRISAQGMRDLNAWWGQRVAEIGPERAVAG
ncbi:MAG TPA: alpha/beta fold hydrolase [Anaerolineae bacterium]|jgi:phospholipase/carboxylesterase|nr:alpha/beta fold hydrolase [Anaerolineae bacterium]